MDSTIQSYVCQRCGRAFALTQDYVRYMEKLGKREVTPILCATCFWRKGQKPKEYGQVKWFNEHKRYGFIETQRGEDIFFHRDQIVNARQTEPQDGQFVRFHVQGTVKGLEALNVELVRE